jgi:kynureninase
VSYKHHFRRFLDADPERIHFAAHSHHLWPDASFDGHMQAWQDAARLADEKWGTIFAEVIPRAQRHVAKRLGLSDPSTIAFAPNTHEFFVRILSCLPARRPPRVLTTDSEFHSFSRQAARLEEDGLLEVVRVPTQPLGSFTERFTEQAAKGGFDLVYVSHVFFNSGYAVPDLARLIAPIPRETFVVVDGYHAFGALPIDLGPLQDRVFYVAGGYKYAMAGEGCCFVHAPPGYGERPRNTGWYASFGALAHAQSTHVAYAPGGARFMGATFDPSALYRFNAVMDWLDREGITAETIHAHAVGLQELFVQQLRTEPIALRESQLVVPLAESSRGQFLTFETAAAADIHDRLLRMNVVTDVRGDRLRFGFGLYHDEQDIVRGLGRIVTALG